MFFNHHRDLKIHLSALGGGLLKTVIAARGNAITKYLKVSMQSFRTLQLAQNINTLWAR